MRFGFLEKRNNNTLLRGLQARMKSKHKTTQSTHRKGSVMEGLTLITTISHPLFKHLQWLMVTYWVKLKSLALAILAAVHLQTSSSTKTFSICQICLSPPSPTFMTFLDLSVRKLLYTNYKRLKVIFISQKSILLFCIHIISETFMYIHIFCLISA